MADTLEIFGVEYTNVAGIIAKDDNGVDQTYTKGGGHLTQDQDGFLVIPPNGSGGGGSSDFSTAQVTIVNSTENLGIELVLPVCTEENAMGQGSPACLQPYNSVPLGTYNVSVAMYKGTALGIIMTSNVNVSTTGAVTFNNGRLIITGDCTITIS